MTSWLKTLLVLALLAPMTAYVAGSLASSEAGPSPDRAPVIIDNPISPAPERPRRSRSTSVPTPADDRRNDDNVAPVATPTPGPADNRDEDPQDDHSARVVTPSPTPVDVTGPVDEDEGTGDDRGEDDADPDVDEDADDDKDADDDRGDDPDEDDPDEDDRDPSDSDDGGSSGSGSDD